MNTTTTFCQSYIDLAYQVLAVSQKPAVMEQEYKRLKNESKHYVDYLERYEPFFEVYHALKKELYGYLSERKTGAFIEYKLDLFYNELTKVEELKEIIQKEISDLRSCFADKSKENLTEEEITDETQKEINDFRRKFADESKEWLNEKEYAIDSCFRQLDTANIEHVIGFLNARIPELKAKKELYLSEIQRRHYDSKAGDRQAEEERKRQSLEEARRKGIELSQQEIQERRRKAQEEFNKQMKRRKR